MNQKNCLWRGCVLAGALVLGASAFTTTWAQAPGNTGPMPGPTAVPLDGGASLLLAAGVGLGLRRLRQRRAVRS